MAHSDVIPQLSVDELIDVIGALLIVLDRDGRIVSFNPACERTSGFRQDEVIGTSVWDHLIPAEQQPDVKKVFCMLADGQGPNSFTNDWVAKNGERRRIAWSNTVSRGADGEIEYLVGTGIDITDQLATEAALRHNRSLLQSIISTSPDAIVTIDNAGLIESFNAAAESMFGYAAHEVIGLNVKVLMPDSYASQHDGYIERYRKTGERRIIGIGREVEAKRKDGAVFPIELSVGEIEIGGRRLFTGFIRDISQRRAAEKARAESDRRLAEAIGMLPLGVILCDTDGRVTHINRETKKLMQPLGDVLKPGIPYEELVRHAVEQDLILLDGQTKEAWLAKRVAQIRSAGRTQSEARYANGSWVLAIEQKAPNGELMALRMDITALKEAQRALHDSRIRERELESEFHHVSRLSAMGEMAATLAHELNQPLTAIGNYVQASRRLLERASPETMPRLQELLGKAVDQAHRAGEIISRLRGFVTRGEAVRAPAAINDIVQEACELALVGTKAAGIDVTMVLDDALPPVTVDRVQIQQVVVNLVRNSVDALQARRERAMTIRTESGDPSFVAVSVSDNGPGLDAKIAENLFEPFNTSKKDGMGIGLSVCRSIVQDHGGAIEAASNPEGGVTFRFTLPVEERRE